MNRRYGRDKRASQGSNLDATHNIKIGCKVKAGSGKEIPAKTNGFYITTRSKHDKRFIVDHDVMEAVHPGYDASGIDQVLKEQLNADPGKLPSSLYVEIQTMAVFDEGKGIWTFPRTASEQYALWHKGGCFCSTEDGVTATRNKLDGTKEQVKCVPYGSEGAEASEFCAWSGPEKGKDCKTNFTFVVGLLARRENNTWRPASSRLGGNARFLFSTTNEMTAIQIMGELRGAAEALNGQINQIPGVLNFGVHDRRRGEGAVGPSVVPVGEASLHLDQGAIAHRARIIHGQLLEDKRVDALLLGSGEQKALPAPQEGADSPQVAQRDDQPAPEPQAVSEPQAETVQEPEVVEGEPVNGDRDGEDERTAMWNGVAAEQEAQAQAQALTMETASDDDLAYSLGVFVTNSGWDFEKAIWFQYPAGRGKTETMFVPDTDWFFNGPPNKTAFRTEKLREICERIAGEFDTFVIHSANQQ